MIYKNNLYLLPASGDESVSLELNINGSHTGVGGAGNTLVICTGSEDSNLVSALYFIRHGHKDNALQAVSQAFITNNVSVAIMVLSGSNGVALKWVFTFENILTTMIAILNQYRKK